MAITNIRSDQPEQANLFGRCAVAQCRIPATMGDGNAPAAWYCVYHFAIHEEDRMRVSIVMRQRPDLVDGTLRGDHEARLELGAAVVGCLKHRIRSKT
jgi:hypothetical protein